jgi:hypothetical protein
VIELYPQVASFSAATSDQQELILESLDELGSQSAPHHTGAKFRPSSGAQSFFEVVRMHTIAGFLVDPESGRRGNRDGVGWKVIDRSADHSFQPPFGYYDKNYPGWVPAASGKDPEKK